MIVGAVGGKTSKTSVLPQFSKIEGGGGMLQCYGGLTSPGRARHAGGAAVSYAILTYQLVVYMGFIFT